ncbi:MAG: chloramphenicol acetyltransferase [Calditrichia bacterium]
MKRKINLDNWNRAAHFHFFRKFEEPFWGVTVELDCSAAYQFCKENHLPFFLYYLHRSLAAANRTEAFRYRIHGEGVCLYDAVDASPTIDRPDGTFGFAYLPYRENFTTFLKPAFREIERVRKSKDLTPAVSGENVIHYTALPWLKFTSLSHARAFSPPDSCPKIAFGKMSESQGRRLMPIAIHVHHALVDGRQVGEFVDLFQELMSTPDKLV